jgi:hypothetical protein
MTNEKIAMSPATGFSLPMPRPGQPGALCFDGKGVTKFLKYWQEDTEEYRIGDVGRCRKLPRYCTEEVGRIVETLDGYREESWEKLKKELIEEFEEFDEKRYTRENLLKLVGEQQEGSDIRLFAREFTEISNRLIDKRMMATNERLLQFLKGLPEYLQRKTIAYFTKAGKSFEAEDDKEPEFKEVVKYATGENKTNHTISILKNLGSETMQEHDALSANRRHTRQADQRIETSSNQQINELTEQLKNLTLLVNARQ